MGSCRADGKSVIPFRDFILYWEGGLVEGKKVYEFVWMVKVMEKFGWDYYTYISQPPFIIRNLINLFSSESEVKKKKDGRSN
jgi:hypothetical protein